MASCSICGRPLTNPTSIRAGVGPICGKRNYTQRVASRWCGSNGWESIEEWEAVNYPCYTCSHFSVPPEGGETDMPGGFKCVKMQEKVFLFEPEAIGGHCSVLDRLVDGNTIQLDVACGGIEFNRRASKKETMPGKGRLRSGGKIETIPFS